MSLADCTTQVETDGHAYGVVTEVETTSTDQKSVKPVATVRCCRCQKSVPMIRLTIINEQVTVLHIDHNLVPYFLPFIIIIYIYFFIFSFFNYFFFFLFLFPVMLYYSTQKRFHLFCCITDIVIVCYTVSNLMAFVCHEIKGLLIYLLT